MGGYRPLGMEGGLGLEPARTHSLLYPASHTNGVSTSSLTTLTHHHPINQVHHQPPK